VDKAAPGGADTAGLAADTLVGMALNAVKSAPATIKRAVVPARVQEFPIFFTPPIFTEPAATFSLRCRALLSARSDHVSGTGSFLRCASRC